MISRADLRDARIVFAKEIVDALRDRRTLAIALVSSVLIGPMMLIMLSVLIAAEEERADRREVLVAGIENAPSLVNFLQRQTYVVKPAPADYERQLRASTLGDPVLVVASDFEAKLARGEVPHVELVSDSANRRAAAGSRRIDRLLTAFGRERAALALALRGVSPLLADPVQTDERDLASTQARAAQLFAMVPFFVMMAVLYGALTAALDTTAGERERGSLEPLLMTPTRRWALVLGKWGAVASLGMLIAALSCFGFLPGQWLLRSDSLQALFQFGPYEALAFLLLLAPFGAALSALLMAVAIRCKSVKEAQASTTLVVLVVSMAPIAVLFNEGGDAAWQLWVPALAQQTLMARVLRGEALDMAQMLIPLGMCVLLAALGIAFVARALRGVAVR